ncbi:MAG: 7-cyano-7-deazaguanine synthase, partial [Spirochaetes bacterium]|nr:7-cyano-7-deazaguanine synthase [Spirochaetota bacterium]
MKKAMVLLSGGLDSATVLAYALSEKYMTYTLSIEYGQRHRIELTRAEALSKYLGAKEHFILHLDPRPFRDSALTGAGEVPLDRKMMQMKHSIAPTYVPARNTIFLSFALAFCEELKIRNIFLGVNYLDYSG